jgi:hypothetical protein
MERVGERKEERKGESYRNEEVDREELEDEEKLVKRKKWNEKIH